MCDRGGSRPWSSSPRSSPPSPTAAPLLYVRYLRCRERERITELAQHHQLLRLGKRPDPDREGHILGLFAAAEEHQVRSRLDALPRRPWMRIGITPLRPHPNDPGGPPGSEPPSRQPPRDQPGHQGDVAP
ncbi:MAG: hypothetical protein JO309_13800 [Pseudonocardiales bacterium]|nr:hypothetical protein [Pseudonocardiales bacterium]